VQVDRDRLDQLAERRSGLAAGRRRGDGALAAAGATSAEQPHSGDVRLAWRQFDAVIDLLWRLRLGRPRVVRRLGWLLQQRQLCFQFSDPRQRRVQPSDQRQ